MDDCHCCCTTLKRKMLKSNDSSCHPMTLNKSFCSWAEIPTPNTYSSQWRLEEVRKIYKLMREEYEQSKRLTPLARNREMERILQMFTSDAILQKMRAMTRNSSRENLTSDSNFEDCPSELSGLKDSNSDTATHFSFDFETAPVSTNKCASGRMRSGSFAHRLITFVQCLIQRSSTTRNKVDSPGRSITETVSSPTPNISVTSVSEEDLSSPKGLTDSQALRISSVTTPVVTPRPVKKLQDQERSQVLDTLSINSAPSTRQSPSTLNAGPRSRHASLTTPVLIRKRTGIETCVISKESIPDFLIPPTSKNVYQKPCKRKNASIPLTTSPGSDQPLMRSMSSLNEINMLMNCSDVFLPGEPQRPSQSVNGSLFKVPVNENFFFVEKVTDISDNAEAKITPRLPPFHLSTEINERLIETAYKRIIQLKKECEDIQNKNCITRYRKMKEFLKLCSRTAL